MGREARRNKGKRKAREVAAQGFTPEQLKMILEAGNSETLCEFAGVKCLHNLSGAIMSVETLTAHRLSGCRPLRVADNFEDLTRGAFGRAYDPAQDSDGSRH